MRGRTVVALFLVLIRVLAAAAADPPQELWEAAKNGDVAKVKALVEAGVDVNAKTPHGSTALGLAADNGRLEVVQLLIEHKAAVNVSDLLGYTPLGQALSKKHTAVAKVLLEAGAAGERGLLGTVARSGDVELVEFILAKTKVPPQQLAQVLQMQYGPPMPADVQKLLINALLEAGGASVETALTAAARASNQANNTELLQFVIDKAHPTPKVIVKVLEALAAQQLVAQKLLLQILLEAGGPEADSAFVTAARRGQLEAVRTILDKVKPQPESLNQALAASFDDQNQLLKLLRDAGATGTPRAVVRVAAETLQSYAGVYAFEGDEQYQMALEDGKLVFKYNGRPSNTLQAIDQTNFHAVGNEAKKFTFQLENGKVTALTETSNRPGGGGASGTPWSYRRVESGAKSAATSTAATINPSKLTEEKPVVVAAPQNWPSFRGPSASGVADGQLPPTQWDVAQGIHIRWKTPIPGLGHASPIVWNDRVFAVTAISSDPAVKVQTGFDDSGSLKDAATYSWRVYCLNKQTGKIRWEQIAHEGLPQAKRHAKATFANSTPATDGQFVIVCFGSEGLFCYDFDGKLVWKLSLGVLDLGWAYDSGWKWDYGFASSPIIYRGMVIVQCDWGKTPFLAAYDIKTGNQVWRTVRQELPTHAVPAIYEGPDRAVLIANSASHIRGYDPLTGQELWSLAYDDGGDAVPTPVVGHGLIFVTHGWTSGGPMFAIRPEATGDISLTDNQVENQFIAWSNKKEGPYLPTPIVYGDYLYSCSFKGILTCLEAKTGKRVYRERLGGANSYTASPVAADGKLYFAGEDGAVRVVKAGPKFETLAVNEMGDACLATPAISDGMVFVRTLQFLYGIGRKQAP